MALYLVTAKKTGSWGKVHFEKGMNVEVVIQGATHSASSQTTISSEGFWL